MQFLPTVMQWFVRPAHAYLLGVTDSELIALMKSARQGGVTALVDDCFYLQYTGMHVTVG